MRDFDRCAPFQGTLTVSVTFPASLLAMQMYIPVRTVVVVPSDIPSSFECNSNRASFAVTSLPPPAPVAEGLNFVVLPDGVIQYRTGVGSPVAEHRS